ncbi:hypothetical protein L1987_03215 [Smallanthus sonchifolius]|uniref:Uncharacterized protein n=1 Tax=Smallanthus sonchifolius TaxID=185202 RepID=A0ACB9K9Y7_9ASTR|nr:hypothetical protein L1987_03215 [Smallanthus sonchifolius]
MATITTKISYESVPGEQRTGDVANTRGGGVDWKWVAVGGAVAVFFGVRTGTVGKLLVGGAGKRFGRRR